MKLKPADLIFAIVIIAIVLLLIIPLPTFLMDALLVINIALALIILLLSMYIKDPLEFSVFPTLLLIITLFRMALNLSSTRLILGNEGDAGNVIRIFGSFVIGDNLVVGIITFAILLVMQFMVITKGAERVAEVTARFTLDAMPGKQMAIDADLNSGLIDETQARERREKIQQESDFHGAMDGASKFIKGDAIAGLLVTIINIVGGLIIGILTMDKEIMEVVDIFVLATVGDGLVSQIPAVLISTSAGIIVTRSGTQETIGTQVTNQLFGQPFILVFIGVLLVLLSIVPGMPKIPMWLIAILMISVGIITYQKITNVPEIPQEIVEEQEADEKRKPENVSSLLHIEPIELEIGYGLIPMVEVSQGGDLLDRVVTIRRQCAFDLGIMVPKIRICDNVRLPTSAYAIRIKGVDVAYGEVMLDHLLAISSGGEDFEEIAGIPTVDPVFGVPALWIPKSDRELAEISGYSTYDPPNIISLHLTEIIKRHGHELLNRQQVQALVENLKRYEPALVDEVVPKMFSLGEIQKVLAGLLREDVPIKDMATIIETLGDYGGITRDTELLTEYARTALKRMISKRFIPDSTAHVITLDPALEQLVVEHTKQSERGMYLTIEPAQLNTVFERLRELVERISNTGITPIVLTSPLVRRQFRKIAEQISPDLVVLSYDEVEMNVEISSEGVVRL